VCQVLYILLQRGNIIENSANRVATATHLFLRGFDESVPSDIEEANVGIFLMSSINLRKGEKESAHGS